MTYRPTNPLQVTELLRPLASCDRHVLPLTRISQRMVSAQRLREFPTVSVAHAPCGIVYCCDHDGTMTASSRSIPPVELLHISDAYAVSRIPLGVPVTRYSTVYDAGVVGVVGVAVGCVSVPPQPAKNRTQTNIQRMPSPLSIGGHDTRIRAGGNP
jgi:hypothetical protein